MKRLPPGKLSWTLLAELLGRERVHQDARILVGPQVGEDAAVVSWGDTCLVAATDPITFATEAIGYYAVQVNANDVAAMGAQPRWFLATVLLPERETDRDLVERLFGQLSETCRMMGISLIGGHTEITAGLERPIVVGTMLGEVPRDRLVTSAGARAGDVIILTTGLAVEGTALIAREKYDELKRKYNIELLERCKNMLYAPGIGIQHDARCAARAARVHAMHDLTEGGLSCGLWELATASQVGVEVDRGRIRILEETELLCREYGLDPLGLIASGALLIAADAGDADGILRSLREDGIQAASIGRLTRGSGVRWSDGSPVRRFQRDEVARLLEDQGNGK
jgi:hydrogenase maturation factor